MPYYLLVRNMMKSLLPIPIPILLFSILYFVMQKIVVILEQALMVQRNTERITGNTYTNAPNASTSSSRREPTTSITAYTSQRLTVDTTRSLPRNPQTHFQINSNPSTDYLNLVLQWEGNITGIAAINHQNILKGTYHIKIYAMDAWKFSVATGNNIWRDSSSRRGLLSLLLLSAGLSLFLQNIMHRDSKPDDFLVTSSGVMNIGDLRVSQLFEDDSDELWRSLGTPAFAAPEFYSDMWVIGVTLYRMVIDEYPFPGDTSSLDTSDMVLCQSISSLRKPVMNSSPR